MRVLKFGGTSVADADALAGVIRIIAAQRGARVVVVSALAGVTDALLETAALACRDVPAAAARIDALADRHRALVQRIADADRRRLIAAGIDGIARSSRAAVVAIGEAGSPRASAMLTDRLVSAGEIWSSRLLAALLENAGLSARWIDARDVIRTDGQHQRATPDVPATMEAVDRHIRPALAFERIAVVGGFIGSGPDGATTTLGRGGSDFSASTLAACLSADELQIWTDVDGVLTADPRVIPHARVVERLSYEEAQDLATFGAKVLHPATIQPAAERGIPVRVLNAARPDLAGTFIGAPSLLGTGSRMTAVACREGIAMLEVISSESRTGGPSPAAVFRELARRNAQVVLADVCGNRVSVAVDASADLDGFSVEPSAQVRVRRDLAVVCAVGRGWPPEPRLIRDALAALGDVPVYMIGRPSGTAPLALAVDARHGRTAMTRLHDGCLHVEGEAFAS